MPEEATPPADSIALQRLNLLRWIFVGGLVVLVIVSSIVLALQQRVPTLTRAAYDEAYERWADNGPEDYTLEVEVAGGQPAVYVVQVNDGEPVAATRNALPIKQTRTWHTWTVPGMFDTLASDLEALEAGRRPLVLRCEFDPRYGYPVRYQRIESGTAHEVIWSVKRFNTP